jgi:hypothetical protein
VEEQLSIIHIACLFLLSGRPLARTCSLSLFDPVQPLSILFSSPFAQSHTSQWSTFPHPRMSCTRRSRPLPESSGPVRKLSIATRMNISLTRSRFRRYRRARRLPPRRHDRQTSHEQPGQDCWHDPVQHSHFQGQGHCSLGYSLLLALPWSWLCRRLQGHAACLQVRWSALHARLPGPAPQRLLQLDFRQEQRQGYHARHCWQVRLATRCHLPRRIANHTLSLIGIGEIVILPLDILKIKRQTNPEAFRGRGLFKIIADEGFGLYRGWGWTAARNAPGSFAVRILDSSLAHSVTDP